MVTEPPNNSNGFSHPLLKGRLDQLCADMPLLQALLLAAKEEARDVEAQARERLGHSIERLDEVRTDLIEVLAGLPADASSPTSEELAGVFELDALIRCALHDHLDPLLQDLRALHQRGTEEG